MSGARYVVLGAARPRSAWFGLVAQWANSGTAPIEFVKCLGVEEIRARLGTGRAYSAVLLDGGLPGVDRDLLSLVEGGRVAAIVVADARVPIDWRAVGANAVLESDFSVGALVDALASFADVVVSAQPQTPLRIDTDTSSPVAGHVFAVTGSGGVGTSTVAMALAQGLGQRSDLAGRVVLADFSLRAELAMLHDTKAVTPGIQELVEAHRLGAPNHDDVRGLCFEVHGRGYDLLIGLRRRRFWTTIRPAAAIAAFRSLSASYAATVLDTDADVEGESETGSTDVEERNVLARTALGNADTVLAVGHSSMKGLHALTRIIADLEDFGVDVSRIQPVLNYAPTAARARAGYSAALAELRPEKGGERLAPPLFVPDRNVDECVRAARPFPAALVDPLSGFALHRLAGSSSPPAKKSRWKAIQPGFLRSEHDEEAEAS